MNRYLKSFFKIFGGFSRKDKTDLVVAGDEIVTRYVLDKGYLRRASAIPTVKFQAFLPRNGEASVFRISSLSANAVWSLGNEQVARPRGRTIKARADISSESVQSSGVAVGINNLKVVSESSIHPLHANIIGWPEDEGAIQMVAIELAKNASLHLPP